MGGVPGFRIISFRGGAEGIKAEIERILPFTRTTKTVTVEGFIDPAINLTLIADAFPNLLNYRITTDPEDHGGFTPYFPFSCRNVIIFFNEGDGPRPMDADLDFEDFEDFYDEPPIIPEGVMQKIPEGVEKLL